jgi:hypothetical protein
VHICIKTSDAKIPSFIKICGMHRVRCEHTVLKNKHFTMMLLGKVL